MAEGWLARRQAAAAATGALNAPVATPAPATGTAPPLPPTPTHAVSPTPPPPQQQQAIPLQAAGPVAPTATHEAAAAARRSPGRPRKDAAPAAAATPVAAAPAPATTAVAVTASVPAIASGGFLARFVQATARASLTAAIEGGTVSPGGEPNVFPVAQAVTGDSGGYIDLDTMNTEGSDVDVPLLDSKNTEAYAILLGYRFNAVLWPKAYVRGAPKQVPIKQGSVGMDRPDLANLLCKAASHYRFHPRGEAAARYDACGHIGATMDLLLFDGAGGGTLYVYRSAGPYEGMHAMMCAVDRAMPSDQGVQPTPVRLTMAVAPVQSKTQTWDEHYIHVEQHRGDAAQGVIASFREFFTAVGDDPELTAQVDEWQKTTRDEDMVRRLNAIIATPNRDR